MNTLTVINQQGKALIDSRQVAVMVGKPHNELMKSIRQYCDYLGLGENSPVRFLPGKQLHQQPE